MQVAEGVVATVAGRRISWTARIAGGFFTAVLSPAVLAHSADLHAPGDSSWLAWTFEPWVVIPMVMSAFLYCIGVARIWRHAGSGRGIRVGHCVAFAGGETALVAALLSPLDALGGHLFFAHMVQHEVLMLIAAPLFVLSKPLAAWSWALPRASRYDLPDFTRRRSIRGPWRAITHPLTAWGVHAVALWVWHVPALFGLALRHEGWHTLQHATFLITALLFWWSAIGGDARSSHRGVALLSLFTTMIHTGALGALLTFAPRPWYPEYQATAAALGVDPLDDHQLGGLVMWIPGGVAYMIAALAIVGQWLERRTGLRTPMRPAEHGDRPLPDRPVQSRS